MEAGRPTESPAFEEALVKRGNVYGIVRLRRAIVQFITGRIVQALGRMALLLILVRVLTTADFGAYMLIVGLSEMMLQLASFGLLPLGRRYIPQLIGNVPAQSLFGLVAALVFLQLAVLGLITFVIWQVWTSLDTVMGFTPHQIEAAAIAVWLFLLIPAFRFACELLETLLEHGRSRSVAALMVLGKIAGIGFVLGAGLPIDLYTVLLIDVLVTAVCLFLAYAFLCRSVVTLHTRGGTGSLPLPDMMRFAWHMAAVDAMGSTASPGAVRLALANALGVVESGLFAFLQSIQRLVGRYLPGILLRGLVMPVLLARAYLPGGMAVVESGTGLLIKSDLMIVAAGTIVIAVTGDILVEWLSGGKFQGAGTTLLLLYLALATLSQRSIIEMVMQITGKTATLRATAVIAPFALIAIWTFAEYGLNAAILIMIGATAFANAIAAWILIHSPEGFRVDWGGQLAIYGSAAAATMIGVALDASGIGAVPAVFLALAAFGALQVLLKPFSRAEYILVEKAAGSRMATLMLGLMCRDPQRS